jgi:hypothetical protein
MKYFQAISAPSAITPPLRAHDVKTAAAVRLTQVETKVERLERELAVQFKRIADIQVQIDRK